MKSKEHDLLKKNIYLKSYTTTKSKELRSMTPSWQPTTTTNRGAKLATCKTTYTTRKCCNSHSNKPQNR